MKESPVFYRPYSFAEVFRTEKPAKDGKSVRA